MRWLFLLFTVLPVVDLWLLLRIGGRMGFWPTFALTVGMALLGAFLAKREGAKILAQWRRAMAELRMPEDGLVAGVLVIVGAALLAAPGVLTDVVGFALLVPATRRLIAPWVRRKVGARIEQAQARGNLRVQVMGFGGMPGGPARGRVRDDDGFAVREVVDVEGEAVEDRDLPRLPGPR